ncbi:Transposon Ty4-H Gag-Pol polyprotein [Symbiodinium microadriaticum]|uniref:Transposon Ty4-H Gag-Pol polyprotein n=1 Tax=Symbiodinium microadriaticum TaxID=2951 RepID=A0A1Q9F658_SYMMI|nr:Transposon Ty4-H Gag-Pol polyprotein [Symbiodinium microadriaticum]
MARMRAAEHENQVLRTRLQAVAPEGSRQSEHQSIEAPQIPPPVSPEPAPSPPSVNQQVIPGLNVSLAALATMPPAQQGQLLYDTLVPLVRALDESHAGIIVDVLLQGQGMDVIAMLRDPEVLARSVAAVQDQLGLSISSGAAEHQPQTQQEDSAFQTIARSIEQLQELQKQDGLLEQATAALDAAPFMEGEFDRLLLPDQDLASEEELRAALDDPEDPVLKECKDDDGSGVGSIPLGEGHQEEEEEEQDDEEEEVEVPEDDGDGEPGGAAAKEGAMIDRIVDELKSGVDTEVLLFCTPMFTNKSAEIRSAIQEFVLWLRLYNLPVRRVHSDRSKEFMTRQTREWLLQHSILPTFAEPGDKRSNGTAEAGVRMVKCRTRTLLAGSTLPVETWPLAATTACALQRAKQLGLQHAALAPLGTKVLAKDRKYHQERADVTSSWSEWLYGGLSPNTHNAHVLVRVEGGKLKFLHTRSVRIPEEPPEDVMPHLEADIAESPRRRVRGKSTVASVVGLCGASHEKSEFVEFAALRPTLSGSAAMATVPPAPQTQSLHEQSDPEPSHQASVSSAVSAATPLAHSLTQHVVEEPGTLVEGKSPVIKEGGWSERLGLSGGEVEFNVHWDLDLRVRDSDVHPVQSGTIDSSHRDCRDDRHGRKKGPRRHNALPALPEEWRSRINAQELRVLDGDAGCVDASVAWEHSDHTSSGFMPRRVGDLLLRPAGGPTVVVGDGDQVAPQLHKTEPSYLKDPETVLASLTEPLQVVYTIDPADAAAHLDRWLGAIQKEVDAVQVAVHRVLPGTDEYRSLVQDPAVVRVPTKLVYTVKPPQQGSAAVADEAIGSVLENPDAYSRRKARLVCCGNFAPQTGMAAYASGSTPDALRLVLTEASLNAWCAAILDITSAFLATPVPTDGSMPRVVVTPPGAVKRLKLAQDQELWLLVRALYGLREAPRL